MRPRHDPATMTASTASSTAASRAAVQQPLDDDTRPAGERVTASFARMYWPGVTPWGREPGDVTDSRGLLVPPVTALGVAEADGCGITPFMNWSSSEGSGSAGPPQRADATAGPLL